MEESDVVNYIRRVIDPGDDAGPSAWGREDAGNGGLTRVVCADYMNADDFWRHVRIRHTELWYERRIPVLRDEHANSHRLTQFALGHYHDEPDID